MEENTCKRCILNDQMEGVSIGNDGLCNYCRDHKPFIPYGEPQLIKILNKAKKKNGVYDVLVPLSGGKDSTYVLLLASKNYKLNILTYTFDNGFLSELAKKNIETSVKKCGVDHIWVKPGSKLIKDLYRTTLLQSGEICGVCGMGIERAMLKITEGWNIPIILMGHSPTESNSFTTEDIYDQNRLKAIFKKNKNINKQMVKRLLVYPKLNYISSFLYTKLSRFGKKVNILYYLETPTDKEIGNILKKEMDWLEPSKSEYTRHFDCIAEPFTNYIREKRFGNSRRIPQLCNMIRNEEIDRDEAIEISNKDNENTLPSNYQEVMTTLEITEKDIENISKIPKNVFSNKKSTSNKIFAFVRKNLKK